MKKYTNLLFICCLVIGICSCQGGSGVKGQEKSKEAVIESEKTMKSMYRDMSSLMSNIHFTEEEMEMFKKFEKDGKMDIETLKNDSDFIAFIQSTTFYQEMMGVMKKHLGADFEESTPATKESVEDMMQTMERLRQKGYASKKDMERIAKANFTKDELLSLNMFIASINKIYRETQAHKILMADTANLNPHTFLEDAEKLAQTIEIPEE